LTVSLSPPENLEKYLVRWAEPEARALAWDDRAYTQVLAVPALGENVEFLQGYAAAARAAEGRVLVILVVNAAPESDAAHREENTRLLATLSARGAACAERLWRVDGPDFDVLLVDRASPGAEISRRQGVGLARKIAADLALRLYVEGRLARASVRFTDADVTLPASYFCASDGESDSGHGAALFPFRHCDGGDALTHAATVEYELSLRYHVLSLAWAGSPYAFHSIGSTLSVPLGSYAGVRGVPKRAAGEDFYLLDKLAKLGPIRRLSTAPIEIRSRRSARVPFGTGPRVEQLLRSGAISVAAPAAFSALAAQLTAIERFAAERDEGVLRDAFCRLPAPLRSAAEHAYEASGLLEAARSAAREVGGGDLRRRLHTWFDALVTLRWLHRLRDAGIDEAPLRAALERAPFIALPPSATLEDSAARLIELEAALPPCCGPTLPSSVKTTSRAAGSKSG
jgi:hypothetical protein